ncbi:TELO2-interacting protein 1, partial [Paragonimus westermani]
ESVPWEQRKADSLRVLTEYFDSDLLQLPTSSADDVNLNTPSRSNQTDSIPCDSTSPLQKWPVETPPAPVDSVSVTKPSLKELKENAVTVCLLLELFGTASQIYHSCPTGAHASDVCEDLLRIGLVACISRAGHPGLIGQTARHCLRYVSLHCGFTSVAELITRNADFLISNITLDLHRVLLLGADREPLTMPADLLHSLRLSCQTLGTVFEHATIDVVPLLRPLVRQVLTCLDLTYEHHADLFLPALKRLLTACRQWNETRQRHTLPAADYPTFSDQDVYGLVLRNVQVLVENTRGIHHLSSLSDPEPEDHTQKSPPTDEAAQTDQDALDHSSRIYPDHLHIVEEIMLRCIHLLADTDPKLRLLSMDVLIEGYVTLTNERELLLPLVHKAWSALMARFRDQHAVVVEKAFQLLTVLTRVAGDFLRARASSEIMPPLLNFLIRGAGVSAGASRSYRHLTSYRVQKQLLEQMGPLCRQLNLSSETLRSVIHVLIIYLEDEQPHGLQQASEYSLQVLWQLDFGLVWTLLFMQVPKEYQDEAFGASVPNKFCYPLQIRQPSSTDRRRINIARLRSILSRLYKIVPVTNPVI